MYRLINLECPISMLSHLIPQTLQKQILNIFYILWTYFIKKIIYRYISIPDQFFRLVFEVVWLIPSQHN